MTARHGKVVFDTSNGTQHLDQRTEEHRLEAVEPDEALVVIEQALSAYGRARTQIKSVNALLGKEG
jgi:hypothetical protein